MFIDYVLYFNAYEDPVYVDRGFSWMSIIVLPPPGPLPAVPDLRGRAPWHRG